MEARRFELPESQVTNQDSLPKRPRKFSISQETNLSQGTPHFSEFSEGENKKLRLINLLLCHDGAIEDFLINLV